MSTKFLYYSLKYQAKKAGTLNWDLIVPKINSTELNYREYTVYQQFYLHLHYMHQFFIERIISKNTDVHITALVNPVFKISGCLVCFTRKTEITRRVSSAADVTPRYWTTSIIRVLIYQLSVIRTYYISYNF